jgi:RNA polymerase sigma factor (sigma-70 family)
MAPSPGNPLSSLTDEALVERVRAGQVELFELLMRRHNARLYRAMLAILRDPTDAEDVMQEAYVRAYEHLHEFEGRAQFSTWLTRIAIHAAFARLRSRDRFEPLDVDGNEPAVFTHPGTSPEQLASDVEMNALLQEALDELPEEFRSVFVLRAAQGLSVAEAAGILGIAEATVKTRLHRARLRLQETLERIEPALSSIYEGQGNRCDRVVGAVLRRIPYRPERLPIDEGLSRGRALHEELGQRRSCRFFSDEPVPREAIELAIRCASTAPSGANRQPWRFVAVSAPEMKRAIREATEKVEYQFYHGGRAPPEWREAVAPLGTDWRKPYLETAPWLVVVFAEAYGLLPDGSPRKNYHVRESVGMACGLFVVALQRMGLSTVTHTPSPMGFLRRVLGRPANERPFMLLPIGYPAPDATVPDLVRKPFDEIASLDAT